MKQIAEEMQLAPSTVCEHLKKMERNEMGLADTFGAEDRVQVKFSDFL